MAEVTFETTVQKTVIEVEDMTGTPVNVEPTPEVSFSVENGNAGGGSCDIDTTELAKQGENPEATLTAIYKLLKGSEPDTPEVIPEGVAERLALILEFFGIKPIQAYEFMTAEEVCSELEEIMTTMDINLTQEQAKEITQQTLNN